MYVCLYLYKYSTQTVEYLYVRMNLYKYSAQSVELMYVYMHLYKCSSLFVYCYFPVCFQGQLPFYFLRQDLKLSPEFPILTRIG